MQKVNFKTSDGVKIAGSYFPKEGAKKCAFLLHMKPETKESWNKFAGKLNKAGFSVLAIDLRGHGESTEQNGKKINFKKFPNESHKACQKDVDAGIKFLAEKGFKEKDLIMVGGSVGANLAIDAMGRFSEIDLGVALSPGLEYLGVTTEDAMKKIKNGQNVFIVASKDDEYSYDSVEKLQGLNPSAVELKLYEDAGHAQRIFDKHPELMDELIKWLKS